ncbi:hypothetical protein [Desulfogranum mediterraneum]|uniref:hypothetical protein n=1 Tax=Desulfogranum mediterraneum TaxID=160661 RepID=UPI000404CA69|nr:hypothetical protein [Desulfogranum mediterraneum]
MNPNTSPAHSPPPSPLNRYYEGSIAEKHALAGELDHTWSKVIHRDPQIREAMAELQPAMDQLAEMMAAMGLGLLCSGCAADEGGGCCSAFMGGNTDVIQLLMNRLLGCAPDHRGGSEESCCYLGSRGCSFLLKPIFCLNYSCSRITQALGKEKVESLDRAAGLLLQRQLGLEALLLKVIDRACPEHDLPSPAPEQQTGEGQA